MTAAKKWERLDQMDMNKKKRAIEGCLSKDKEYLIRGLLHADNRLLTRSLAAQW